MIVVDTTILVYAVGADHPLRAPARTFVELVRDGKVRATTTVEVIQEFAHVRARRRTRVDAAARAKEYAVGLRPLMHPEYDDLVDGLDLFVACEQLGPFDAVLATMARRKGWPLASADRSFSQVDGLTYFDLGTATFLDEVTSAG